MKDPLQILQIWFSSSFPVGSYAYSHGLEAIIDHKKIDELVIKRNEARSNKDFELADKIRDQLNKMNVEIEDTPDGTVWKIKK